MNLDDKFKWQEKKLICNSIQCGGEVRTYKLIGYDGVAWRRTYIYECKECKERVRD